MSKIHKAFKDQKAFIAYLTAGDPSVDKTIEFILSMAKAGADLVEIGIPFSDPSAEGVVIQNANTRALKNNTSVKDVFKIVEEVRKVSDIPLVFLTYINPVFQYGYDKFFDRCNQLGVDGIIVPDLPFEEKHEISSCCEKHDVDLITLIAPTSDDRIKKLAKDSTGFIYLVSSMGVTGVRSEIKTDLKAIYDKIKAVTSTDVAIGFGIGNKEQAKEMSLIADGVIVGSAIVKIIEEHNDKAADVLYEYVKMMKESIKIL